MTPKELHDELERLVGWVEQGTEMQSSEACVHLETLVLSQSKTILRALSGLEGARVAMENAREQLWHLAKDKENNPWVKELESALSQLDQEAADK